MGPTDPEPRADRAGRIPLIRKQTGAGGRRQGQARGPGRRYPPCDASRHAGGVRRLLRELYSKVRDVLCFRTGLAAEAALFSAPAAVVGGGAPVRLFYADSLPAGHPLDYDPGLRLLARSVPLLQVVDRDPVLRELLATLVLDTLADSGEATVVTEMKDLLEELVRAREEIMGS